MDAARQHLATTGRVEAEARRHLSDLNDHQQARAAALADTAPQRHALNDGISQLDTALNHTRVERVLQLADRPTQLHLDILGPVPVGAASRAVWRHQAHRLERHLDLNHSDDGTWQRLVQDLSVTPTLARIAERDTAPQPHDRLRPTDWVKIAERPTAIPAASIEYARPGPAGTADRNSSSACRRVNTAQGQRRPNRQNA